MKKYLYTLIMLLLQALFICYQIDARLANREDLSATFDYIRKDIKVNLDGTYDSILEYKVSILTEQGRSDWAQVYYTYNEESETTTVIEAETINNGKVYKLDQTRIEDKPLASASHGFDQKRQLLLSFPNVEIGSKIRLKIKFQLLKPVLQGVFSGGVSTSGFIDNLQFNINSQIPLNVNINDPDKILKFSSEQTTDVYQLSVENTKPINNVFVEEPANGILHESKLTWVTFSSSNNWEGLGEKLAGPYCTVIKQPLPKLFKDIRREAAVAKNDIDKINQVTSLLNQKIQYMGDWRSVKGRYFPRSLAEIANSQVGDCKDFSASTAAILQQLGFKVQIVLVRRGLTNLSSEDLPSLGHFNHAMLKVTSKQGQVHWIDPTNAISMAQGIFPDINGKKILVLDLKKSTYEQIPSIDPQHSGSSLQLNLAFADQTLIHTGKFNLFGENSINFTGAQLYASKQQIENNLFFMLSGKHLDEDRAKTIELPDLTSRIVQDLTFNYQYKKNNALINTNLGFGLAIPDPGILDDLLATNIQQCSDLFIGPPITKKMQIILKDVKVKQTENLNYTIDTPWVYFNRECIDRGEYMEINQISTIKRSLISNQDLHSSLYQQFKNDLEHNVHGAMLIIDRAEFR